MGMPPFYISHRIGKQGKDFKHYKLKTMLPGVAVGRIFFEKNRLTPLGAKLRRFHLDEIPELINILKGDMSIVGPRPLPKKLLKGLSTKVRNTVVPGWAGLAQVSLARKGNLDKRLQIYLDNIYVKKRTLGYNLKILLATFSSVLKGQRLNLDPNLTTDRKVYLKTE